MSTVEQESKHLRQELGLTDLVLTQILYVVGLSWVGVAGKLGTSQIPFWLAAIALFYVPQAVVVVHLSRRFPLEGGLYQWAKVGLNEGIAFLLGWTLWVYAIILLGELGISVANAVVYAIGPDAQWLSGNKAFIGAMTGGLLGAIIVISILGLRISKWVHNGGGILLIVAFAVLLSLPLINVARGTLHEYHPLAVTALRLHAERMQLAAAERRLAQRFTAAHPGVPVVRVPAQPEDVHDLAGLRKIGESFAAG